MNLGAISSVAQSNLGFWGGQPKGDLASNAAGGGPSDLATFTELSLIIPPPHPECLRWVATCFMALIRQFGPRESASARREAAGARRTWGGVDDRKLTGPGKPAAEVWLRRRLDPEGTADRWANPAGSLRATSGTGLFRIRASAPIGLRKSGVRER